MLPVGILLIECDRERSPGRQARVGLHREDRLVRLADPAGDRPASVGLVVDGLRGAVLRLFKVGPRR